MPFTQLKNFFSLSTNIPSVLHHRQFPRPRLGISITQVLRTATGNYYGKEGNGAAACRR